METIQKTVTRFEGYRAGEVTMITAMQGRGKIRAFPVELLRVDKGIDKRYTTNRYIQGDESMGEKTINVDFLIVGCRVDYGMYKNVTYAGVAYNTEGIEVVKLIDKSENDLMVYRDLFERNARPRQL